MPRTRIPSGGGNDFVREHNVYDFRALAQTTGNIYFVDSGQTSGSGLSPEDPVSTIDAAVNLCTANNGDVIFVMEGHTETISAAAGVAQDVAGVSIIGLGQGNDRPLVSFSATDSTWAISAASCLVKNIRVKSTVNELVKMFNITGADVTLDGVDVLDPGSAKECLQFALTTSAADRLTIKNCTHYASTAGASAQKWIALVGCDQPRILDCTFLLVLADQATSSVINMDSAVTYAELGRLKIHMKGYTANLVSAILAHASATGIHYDSRIYGDTAVVTTLNDFPGGASFEVYCSNDLDKNGILDPVVGS